MRLLRKMMMTPSLHALAPEGKGQADTYITKERVCSENCNYTHSSSPEHTHTLNNEVLIISQH